ncbi:MAG: fibronectin type III domain-containing protein, partial [Nitrospirota bacterium]|nr:fibronectin type III domain-containing protein [Nitrospirota bacterium]
AWVEDPGINGCNHCHNTTITAGNANGSNRKIAHSPAQGSDQTGARRNNWSSTVSYMTGKGCPATSAATTYLNACYCATCSNPYPEGTSCLYVVDTEDPSTPTNVVGTPDPSGTKIALTWTASTDNVGVTGYNIYQNYGLTPVGSSATTSYTDTGLTPETTYTYEIEAYDAAGNKSPKSSPIQATTAALPGDTVSPAPPLNLTAVSDISGTKVFIAWDPATDNMGIASYNIYRDGGSTAIGSSSTLTFLDTGLTPATTYFYELEAVDLSGNVSVRSAAVVVTTNFGSLLTNATVVCTLPAPGITNFVITPAFTDSGGGSIYIATGDNAIYRCTKSGGTWTRSGNLWPYSGAQYNDNPVYDVKMLAITPNFISNQTLFAATGGGFYKSVNAGASWGINNTMMYGFNLTSLGVSPGFATDNTIYAGNWEDFMGQGGGLQTWDPMLYKSTVGGGSWA